MDFRARPTLTRLLTLLLSSVVPMTRGHAEGSGKVGAVNPDATGTPPGGASRTLVIGTGVVYKEKIQTSPQGSTQILFPDQSTLNLGGNTNIVIDEYVYDPKTGTGWMAATLGKGVMRFVGGQISHTSGMTVQTPVGTLGVRGGSVTIVYPIPASVKATDPNVAACQGELVSGHIGIVTATTSAGSAIVRPGYAACVTPTGQITTFPIPANTLSLILALLTSNPGQHGGAIDLPTDQMASRSGLGGGIVNDPTHPPGSDPLGLVSIFAGGDGLAKDKSNNTQAGQTVPPPPPRCVECNYTFGPGAGPK
jgi:hypothetical protein